MVLCPNAISSPPLVFRIHSRRRGQPPGGECIGVYHPPSQAGGLKGQAGRRQKTSAVLAPLGPVMGEDLPVQATVCTLVVDARSNVFRRIAIRRHHRCILLQLFGFVVGFGLLSCASYRPGRGFLPFRFSLASNGVGLHRNLFSARPGLGAGQPLGPVRRAGLDESRRAGVFRKHARFGIRGSGLRGQGHCPPRRFLRWPQAALVRRLYFEATTLAAADMRRWIDRVDDDSVPPLPTEEREARLARLQARLVGLELSGDLDPSSSLIHAVHTMSVSGLVIQTGQSRGRSGGRPAAARCLVFAIGPRFL